MTKAITREPEQVGDEFDAVAHRADVALLADSVRTYGRKSRTVLRLLTGSVPSDVGQGPRVMTWERRAEWPLAAFAALFLVAYAAQVLWRRPSDAGHVLLEATIVVTWVAFALDYAVRVLLARKHVVYALRHWVDLVIIALPVLRQLRVLRVIMLVRALNRKAAANLRGRVILFGAVSVALLIFCASLAVLDAERHDAAANIKGFGDALWWSVVTICTVGYGDKFPTTGEGRLVGVGLMISGVGLFGAVTASFATWLVDSLNNEQGEAISSTHDDLELLRGQLEQVNSRVVTLQASIDTLIRSAQEQRGRPPDS